MYRILWCLNVCCFIYIFECAKFCHIQFIIQILADVHRKHIVLACSLVISFLFSFSCYHLFHCACIKWNKLSIVMCTLVILRTKTDCLSVLSPSFASLNSNTDYYDIIWFNEVKSHKNNIFYTIIIAISKWSRVKSFTFEPMSKRNAKQYSLSHSRILVNTREQNIHRTYMETEADYLQMIETMSFIVTQQTRQHIVLKQDIFECGVSVYGCVCMLWHPKNLSLDCETAQKNCCGEKLCSRRYIFFVFYFFGILDI